jgi:predicted dehydrogenase
LKTKNGRTGTITVSWTYEYEDASTVFYCENGVMTIYGHPDYQIVIMRNNGTSDYYKVGEIPNNIVQVKTGIIDEFVSCIVEGKPATISGIDGLEPLKVVFSAYESSEKNKMVEIKE